MSLDYTAVGAVSYVAPTAAIANGTVVQWTSASIASNAFMVVGFSVNIITGATSATQSVALQSSDTAGSFSSPTTLATITILAVGTDAIGTVKEAFVSTPALSCLQPGQRLRVVHIATSTDATLKYGVEIFRAPTHC